MPIGRTNLERFKSIESDVALARFIRTGVNEICFPEMRVSLLREWLTGVNRKSLYYEFSIHKKSGGTRKIHAPHFKLKLVQKLLAEVLNEAYLPKASSAAHGYIVKRSIKTNAIKHEKKRCVLRIDIEDFFPSIHLGRVRGILMSPPFSLKKDVADLVAKLCTFPQRQYETILPQGAPTSPVLSNLICRNLDREMTNIAIKHRCHYSRYADDLTFSTDRSTFPHEIQYKEKDSIIIGEAILRVIRQNNFEINHDKTFFKNKHSRQIVTGLIVNNKVNIPRNKIRELRAILHSCNVNGITYAREVFTAKHDKKNRSYEVTDEIFKNIITGRVQYVGFIKGWNDKVYLKLAQALAIVNGNFTFDESRLRISNQKFHLLTEGKTDKTLIEAALKAFKSEGRYTNLNIDFTEYSKLDMKGDTELHKFCKEAARNTDEGIKICLFDRDNKRILDEVKGSNTHYRDWTNNIYSLVLPYPSFRDANLPICIEHYFPDNFLSLRDSNNRRLYRKEEFDSRTGFHTTDNVIASNPTKATQIIDNDVYDLETKQNIALSKNDFANHILNRTPPFNIIDYSAFELLFEEFIKILELFES